MPWTPLHAALGEAEPVLDYALFERACQAHTLESTNLDWKRALPLSPAPEAGKQAQELELAKDIAALANSGGGMIAYGVVQKGGKEGYPSAAERIAPVGPLDEGTLRDIRRVAGTLVYPPVTGLELVPVTAAPDDDMGVLALLVPDSPETPHLVHPKAGQRDWFVAPYRDGSETAWMVERQIATAYVAREARRRQGQQAFDERFNGFVDSLPGGDSTWVVAFAVPDVPLPRPRDLGFSTAHRIISRASDTRPLVSSFGPLELTASATTRRGLQRFVRQGQRTLTAGGLDAVPRARVELHGDGSVAVAFTRDGYIPAEGRARGQVALDDFESVARDLFALLWEARVRLRVTSDYIARITVTPTTQVFRVPSQQLAGAYETFNEAGRVYGYGPVSGPIVASEGLEGALRTWFDVANDAINQTGYTWPLDAGHVLLEMQLAD